MAALRRQGLTFEQIGARVGCSERTARRYTAKVRPELHLPQANPELDTDPRVLRERLTSEFLQLLYENTRLRSLTVTWQRVNDSTQRPIHGGPPSILFLSEAERLIREQLDSIGLLALRFLAREKRSKHRFLREVVGSLYQDYVCGISSRRTSARPVRTGGRRGSVRRWKSMRTTSCDSEECGLTPDDFRAKWRTEAQAMRRRNAIVEGATLCEEMLRDFEAVVAQEAEAVLNLREAATESGYSADYLGRLIRKGRIPNAGHTNAPKIRRSDLPRKASGLRWRASGVHLPTATPRQIARAVVTSDDGDTR
jgi:hypothetical protein